MSKYNMLHENTDDLLMVDAACDLSHSEFYQHNRVGVLPLYLINGTKNILDDRNEKEMKKLYKIDFFNIEKNMSTFCMSKESLKEHIRLFLKKAVKSGLKPRSIHIQQVMAHRTNDFENRLREIQREFIDPTSKFHKEVINIVGYSNFSMRIYSTNQISTGQGMIALHTLEQFDKNNILLSDLRKELNQFIPYIKTYIIPNSVQYIHKRTPKEGRKALSRIQLMLIRLLRMLPIIEIKNGKGVSFSRSNSRKNAFQQIIKQLENDIYNGKLKSQNVCLSYAGDLDDFKQEFSEELIMLELITSKAKINTYISMASSGATLLLGQQSIFLSYAS